MPVEQLFTCPPDLTIVPDEDLAALEAAGTAEFDRLASDFSSESVAYAGRIADDLDRVRVEAAARAVRAEQTSARAQDTAQQAMAALALRVNGAPELAEPVTAAGALDADAIAAAAARGVTQGLMAVMGNRRGADAVTAAAASGGVSLGAIRQQAAPQLPTAELRIISAVDVPSHAVTAGAAFPDMDALVEAYNTRANNIPITRAGRGAPVYPVAQVRGEFDHTVDERTRPGEIERLHRSMTGGDKTEALLAGGGWCAPSEYRYDLFNIAEAPIGMIDMPTIGVSRGGIQFPVSPAIGDVFFTANAASATATGMGGFAVNFSNASDPWLWTETDDIATVTGSVNKPNLRVPCPSFTNVRLEAYGMSLIAGNLTDSAYPENTQNTLRLLRAAYAHAINARLIGLMVTASGGANTIGAITTDPAAPRIFNSVGLAATDYRARYAMRTDAVLECVFPYWVKEVIRADLGYKVGIDSVELLAVMDAQIDNMFTSRGVRMQWVDDWQVRGANQFGNATVQLVWPTSVQFMIYAAGTFLHGTGLQLDLGVIRDSVLNAENDFTAAWAEQAHLVAMVGHASRLYTCAFQVNGSSGGGTTARV